MAAIEKVCEYGSDEYLGFDMYKHKKNHIQVNPSARKYFKNKKCTLYIKLGEWVEVWKPRGTILTYSRPDIYYNGPDRWFVRHWDYMLKFEQPELQGNVDGEYINHTFDLGTTVRKLKRLVGGTKYMNIVYEFNTKDNAQYKYYDIVKQCI